MIDLAEALTLQCRYPLSHPAAMRRRFGRAEPGERAVRCRRPAASDWVVYGRQAGGAASRHSGPEPQRAATAQLGAALELLGCAHDAILLAAKANFKEWTAIVFGQNGSEWTRTSLMSSRTSCGKNSKFPFAT